jgi:hypothetical protein
MRWPRQQARQIASDALDAARDVLGVLKKLWLAFQWVVIVLGIITFMFIVAMQWVIKD